jgi:hypothetical protein
MRGNDIRFPLSSKHLRALVAGRCAFPSKAAHVAVTACRKQCRKLHLR